MPQNGEIVEFLEWYSPSQVTVISNLQESTLNICGAVCYSYNSEASIALAVVKAFAFTELHFVKAYESVENSKEKIMTFLMKAFWDNSGLDYTLHLTNAAKMPYKSTAMLMIFLARKPNSSYEPLL